MIYAYLTTDILSERIHYEARTIRDCLIDTVLLESIHYFHPFGGHKILYIWENIERGMKVQATSTITIPMANGEV